MKKIYKSIRNELSYIKAANFVLPNLGKKFSTIEFYEYFLLYFNENKSFLITDLGLKKLMWWIHNYYLPRMVKKYDNPYIRLEKGYNSRIWINPQVS